MTSDGRSTEFPWVALLALSTAAFLAILTEALPAGVLPEMAASLSVSESAAGQLLTIYALATGVFAIAVVYCTSAWPRKPLIMGAVAVIGLANGITAVSSSYPLTLTVRLLAGIAAAAVWAELVGYARRLAPPHLQGRAISVTMAGIPLALALGIPAGTFLGDAIGWRATFGLIAVVSSLLLLWIGLSVPSSPGQVRGHRPSIVRALAKPGVLPVLFTVGAWVLAHNIVYTYIAPLLAGHGLSAQRDKVLLVFGLSCVVSIVATGVSVDHRLRGLMLASSALFTAGAVGVGYLGSGPAVYVAVIMWGLGWGGLPTLLQTAVNDAGGAGGQALLVTVWNVFMGVGGGVGGVLLAASGPQSFSWAVMALMVPTAAVVILARRHGFPDVRASTAPPTGQTSPPRRQVGPGPAAPSDSAPHCRAGLD